MSTLASEPASKRAKLDVATQLFDRGSNIREVAFSVAFPTRELKLIEIPSDLMKKVEMGEDLRIIGMKNSEAVLSSNNTTYALKRVETSNCVLFVPPSTDPRFTIESIAADYYELRQIPGRLEQLKSLLLPVSIYPTRESSASSGSLLSLLELQQLVQASPQEILTVLVSLGAVEVEGKVRVVSQELVRAVTAALLENIIAQQWSIAAVSEQECSTALQASSVCTDLVVLQSALRLLSVPAGSAGSAGSALTWETVPVLPQPATTWSLDPSRLKQAAAHVVFRERTQDAASASGSESGPGPVQLGVAEFVQEWTLRTPGFSVQEVSDADLALLRGIAVRVVGAKDKTTEDTLHYLPVEDMEQSAKVRLEALYRVKEGYSLEELAPYVQDLVGVAGAPKTIQELLALHTKIDSSNGLFTCTSK